MAVLPVTTVIYRQTRKKESRRSGRSVVWSACIPSLCPRKRKAIRSTSTVRRYVAGNLDSAPDLPPGQVSHWTVAGALSWDSSDGGGSSGDSRRRRRRRRRRSQNAPGGAVRNLAETLLSDISWSLARDGRHVMMHGARGRAARFPYPFDNWITTKTKATAYAPVASTANERVSVDGSW